MHRLTQVKKSAINGVIHASDERSLVRTKKQCERRHFFRLGHPPDRLRLRELLEHLLFPARIILADKSLDERSVNPCRRDAIAANVVTHVVSRDGVGHREHCALAHGVSKAVRKPCRAGNRSQVQDHALATGLHVLNAAEHAVVNALHVHLKDAVEFFLRRILQFADVRDAGVVYQNVDWLMLHDVIEDTLHIHPNTYIAGVRFCFSARVANFRRYAFGMPLVHVNNMDAGSMSGEGLRDRASDTTASPGDNRNLVIQPERPITPGATHRETPLFHGIKSSWASDSALVCTSPLATRRMSSKIVSPISSTVLSPEMMGPASMSIMSGIRCARFVFVEILTTGAMGLPVGVP